MDGVIVLGVLILVASLIGGSLAYGLSSSVPTPENRPAPPQRIADLERQRDEVLEKLAARSREQRQREAAARISRGY